MDSRYYLHQFKKAAELIDKNLFPAQNIKVDIWLDSVVLKIQRPDWLGNPPMRSFEQSVFFSIWVHDETLKHDRIYYNIHALKLRELKGHKIKSRDFAEAFRKAFKPFEKNWPNVSTAFGPLTLMEGWVEYDDNKPEIITGLVKNFAQIQFIIDNLFTQYRKS